MDIGRPSFRARLLSLAALLLAGCTGPYDGPVDAASAGARVTGTVSYRERVTLSPAALITVKLVDVSRADAAAIVLGEQQIRAAGRQVPFEFSIAYDPARIDPRLSYAVEARIEDGGELLFISDRHYAVLTRGATDQIDLVLKSSGVLH
jgi:putative lipoprotein